MCSFVPGFIISSKRGIIFNIGTICQPDEGVRHRRGADFGPQRCHYRHRVRPRAGHRQPQAGAHPGGDDGRRPGHPTVPLSLIHISFGFKFTFELFNK